MFLKPLNYIVIAAFNMRQQTVAAVFDFFAVLAQNHIVVSAAVKRIQRTKAKKAVYIIHFVTRIKLTFFIFKIFVAHIIPSAKYILQ